MTDDERFKKDDQEDVVNQLLSEMGVDDEMRKDLVESGRMSSDIVKVASAEQVRRRMEIEKSIDRLRDSLNLMERNVTQIESNINRIESDLVPVVLSFLVSLKGNLVKIRTSVIDQSKSQAKTHLQATYAETTVKNIVEEKFGPIEESLSSDMSAPIMGKVREISDGFRAFLEATVDEMANLKDSIEDYTQRTSTELEFLTKELSMKPKVEVPKEVQDEIRGLKRKAEQLQHELGLTMQKLKNREEEIIALQTNLATTKTRNETLEQTIQELRSTPTMNTQALVELRQKIKTMETEKELLEKQLADSKSATQSGEETITSLRSAIAQKDIELQDLKQKVTSLHAEIDGFGSRMRELDEMRAKVRSLESGDTMRELERAKSELERLVAANERLSKDHAELKQHKEYSDARIESYMALMNDTEKTKAFLILEDNKEITLQELRKSFGVAPATVNQWAADFVRLGIAKLDEESNMLYLDIDPTTSNE